MEFVQYPYQEGETVAAIATPPGEGGIAIIRLSGRMAFEIGAKVFSGHLTSYKTHTAHLGYILDHEGKKIDECLALVMRGPKSYTGEDTVEFQCHGGAIASQKVLETVLKAGARPALPGEFTLKAYMNGKIDLSQAEAVQELIGAKNELAFSAASNQLEGQLSKRVKLFQKKMIDFAGILEAWVDFPEEGLEFISLNDLCMEFKLIIIEIQKLISTFNEGQKIHEGLSLCIVGSPNAGKSSLMNALLGKERAIVSSKAGTTRDILEDQLILGGLNLKLLDTAGIRETDEEIEQEGIRRTRQVIEKADLILLVLDASKGLTIEEEFLLKEIPPEKSVAIWNKMDLEDLNNQSLNVPFVSHVSAKSMYGLEELKKMIQRVIWENGPPSKEEVVLTNIRHKKALEAACLDLTNVVLGLENNLSPEFITIDMRQALFNLGTIIGSNITEDILSSIFSRFCIGK